MLEQTLKPVRLSALLVPQELAKDRHTRDLEGECVAVSDRPVCAAKDECAQ